MWEYGDGPVFKGNARDAGGGDSAWDVGKVDLGTSARLPQRSATVLGSLAVSHLLNITARNTSLILSLSDSGTQVSPVTSRSVVFC
jgi:hypothetical protein